jgi:hypothetical protein
MPEQFDLNDLILEVQAEFAEIIQEFTEELQEPQARLVLQMQWAQLDPDDKELIRQRDPERYARFEQFLEMR